MHNLSFVEGRRRLRALGSPLLVEGGVALGCIALSVLVRFVIDTFAPGALAFGVIYPICLFATLLAGWRSGLACLAISGLMAWYFVLNPHHGFDLPDVKAATNVVLFFLTAAFIVIIADRAVGEQDKVVAERDLMVEEINHRMKNNFQIVISLLELQARRSGPEVKDAMEAAVARIGGLARSHRNLYPGGDARETVAMDLYLAELCENLVDRPELGGFVTLKAEFQPISLPRDRAVAVGVVLNELLTNAFKHAFPEGRPGVVKVSFVRIADGYALTVADDGVGLGSGPDRPPTSTSGLGRGLIDGFARNAGGAVSLEGGPDGGAVGTLILKV